MNIEFIKWLVGYAEGFELSVMSIGDYDPDPKYSVDIATSTSIGFGAIQGLGDSHSYAVWHYIYYPLLLQRAIEGINKTTVGTVIDQYCDYIEVTTDKKDLKLDPYNQMFPEDIGFDAAKEEALEYTWERLK